MHSRSWRRGALVAGVASAIIVLAACDLAGPQQTTPPSPAAPLDTVTALDVTPAVSAAATATATVEMPPDPPRVLRRGIERETLNDRRPVFRITFDRPMDELSVASAVLVTPEIVLDLRWDGDSLLIQPHDALQPGGRYRFTLGRSAIDDAGLAIEQAVSWPFELPPLLRTVEWPDWSAGRPAIAGHFNYPLDPVSAEHAFRIEPLVAGRLALANDGAALVFTPTVPLTNNTTFRVSFVSLLVDAQGSPLPGIEPQTYRSPPVVLKTQPVLGTSFASPDEPVWIEFGQPMNQQATEAGFSISPPVPGRFVWRNTTLSFAPEQGYLEENTDYTVTLATTATRVDGAVVLKRPFVLSFRTERADDTASFGQGPNAQGLDAAGRRAVPFIVVDGVSRVRLAFELRRLDLAQFVDRYASGFRSFANLEDRPIRTDDLELSRRWEITASAGPTETVIPADVPPGLYVLNLVSRHIDDQLLVVLTRHTIVAKNSLDSRSLGDSGNLGNLVSWVTQSDGRPAPGVSVTVVALDGAVLAKGVTDGDGLYRAEAMAVTPTVASSLPGIIVAQAGDDVSISGLSSDWEWTTRDDPREFFRPRPAGPAQRYAVHLYSDRPIYRPGQTVFYKAVIRRDDDAVMGGAQPNQAVSVRIRDARDNIVQTLLLTTSVFGTVDGSFAIAGGAMLGDYAIEMLIEDESHRLPFRVEDYPKPDYTVDIATDRRAYSADDPISVTIVGRYLLGAPVPNAHVTVRTYDLSRRYGLEMGTGDDSRNDYAWYDNGRTPLVTTTGPDGLVTATLTARLDSSRSGYSGSDYASLGIEATVEDGSGQSISNFAVVRVFDTDRLIDLNTSSRFTMPGQPITATATLNGIDGQPVAAQDILFELRRFDPDSRDFTLLAQDAVTATDSAGMAVAPLTPDEPGYYQIHAGSEDSSGRAIEDIESMWVLDDTNRWTARVDAIHVGADRANYAPGDTAQLFIQSPLSGTALLSFERGTVRRAQVIQLTAPLTRLSVPIQPDDAPNVVVSVSAWRPQDTRLHLDEDVYLIQSKPDSALEQASVELRVRPINKALTITLTPDKPAYAPRDEAAFTVRVTDERGRPVVAELSLALVDEAIFRLADDPAGSIFGAFYDPRPHLVGTYHSMAPQRWLYQRDTGGGDAIPDLSNPRSIFPDTAVWLPAVRTNRQGVAVVKLTLPDNLTTWRLTAKAITPDTQAGEATLRVTTRLDIAVRPLLPRGLIAGDQAVLSAMIHNLGDTPRQLAVSASCPAACGQVLQVEGDVTQTIALAPGEQKVVGWTVHAGRSGAAELVIVAVPLSPDETLSGDAVAVVLPVRPLAIPDVASQAGQFTRTLETDVLAPDGAQEHSQIEIELYGSPAGSLLNGLLYLTDFPYGCVEQTMSRALPNAVVGRALHELALPASNAGGFDLESWERDLASKINAGLQLLYGYQHADGGWGWWHDDETHDYQTAWVVFGLALTTQAGYEVDPAVVARGATWLMEHVGEMDLRTRAYALYSLAVAGHGNVTATMGMAPMARQLDPFSLAALALAQHELGLVEEARASIDLLAGSAVVKDEFAYWETGALDGDYRRKTMASRVRSTALALSALARIAPDHPLRGPVEKWLMAMRRERGWGTTHETAYAILALSGPTANEMTTPAQYRIDLNGAQVATGRLGAGALAARMVLSSSQIQPGFNRLSIQQATDSPIYYVITSRMLMPQAGLSAAGPVSVTRVYLDERDQPAQQFHAGDLVKVKLTITLPEDLWYVLVEDFLPAGLEAIHERLNTTRYAERESVEPGTQGWRDLGYNMKDIRDGRVSFFSTQWVHGPHTITYYARAAHPGAFAALPAEASAMYDAQQWGRSTSASVRVEP